MKLPKGWSRTTLQEVAHVIDCKHRTPSYCDLGVPIISPGSIEWGPVSFKKCNRVSVAEHAELMSHCKVDLDDIVLSRNQSVGVASYVSSSEPFALGQDTVLIKPRAIAGRYLYHFISSFAFQLQVKKVGGGSTFSRINLAEIRKLAVAHPPLPEQRKIADILTTWDGALEKLDALIEAQERRKKALMQQLLTRASAGPSHARHRMGEVLERVTRRNTTGSDNVMTISAQGGLVNQREYFNRSVAGADLSNYYLLHRGEFAYNRSYSNGYPYGAIKRLDQYEVGVVSTLYLCFRIKDGAQVSADYLSHYFEGGRLNAGLRSIAKEGARAHGLLNVTSDEFFDLDILLPSFAAQRQIAAILDTADQQLTLLRTQRTALDQQKRGLMQRLLTGKLRVKP